MNQTRREFLRFGAVASGLALTGWATLRRDPREEARQAGFRFLQRQQKASGAWSSSQYPIFQSGEVLTPLVLWAISSGPVPGEFAAMRKRALQWLEGRTDLVVQQPEPWAKVPYPLFTASYAARALAANGDPERAALWADSIEQLRIRPELGWSPTDPACGAWSDSALPPRPPAAPGLMPDMIAPNLSVTLLAVQALQATGRTAQAKAALHFIETCQNYGTEGDGGFFFTPGDPIRNKAGVVHREPPTPDQIRSYGSTTCDGLLALQACGISPEAPRWKAAVAWLERQADGLQHGGDWPAERGGGRESLVFYQAQAFAAVLARLTPSPWVRQQKEKLAAGLISRQETSGAWMGATPDSCEDEPLIATAFALRALSQG